METLGFLVFFVPFGFFFVTTGATHTVSRPLFDPQTYIIHRSQLQLGDQKAVDSRIRDLKLNERVDESLFKVALQ